MKTYDCIISPGVVAVEVTLIPDVVVVSVDVMVTLTLDVGIVVGCSPPPPAISGHTKGWMCCYKNTLKHTNSCK